MRDYDPTTGRYIQADPLGLVDGASVYGYALQNPGRWTDPTGEAIPFWVAGAAIGLGLGLLEQYMQHGTNFLCYDWLGLGVSGVTGAFGGGIGWRAAGFAGKGKVFSHAIPARAKNWFGFGGSWGKKFLQGGKNGNKYNGNFVSKKQHYKHDNWYYGHEKGDGYLRRNHWGQRYPRPYQLFDRIPYFYKGAFAVGSLGFLFDLQESCECQR